ncbi:acetyl-CoA acetyltransferase [Sphingorhabdus arenilitoris]|uniref:Acetyl-CoA acetyltransferase n=1 Tax=Sphingorhabdus arenilitoris TaxID=1490041 RepID=A0ABV8RD67_9SPHN
MPDIYILGGHQSDFAENWTRQERSLYDLFADTLKQGMAKCALDATEIQVGHVGNFVAELFTGQGMLGGFFGHVDRAFAGMPAARHEGACASGSLAILAAMADIESGRYDLACVLGIELMRNVSGHQASENLGAAIWVGQERQDATFIWPAMFSDLADEYDRRYGLKHEHLAEIGRINFANAKRNPNAQTRGWQFEEGSFAANDDLNPVVEGWMRRQDCSQISDGAAVLFLASAKAAKAYADRRGIAADSLPRIKGWGHRVAPMLMQTKLEDSKHHDYVLPWTRAAITDAYARAGVSGPEALDAIETHDCFTISEYMAIEHFGITAPGEAWKAIEAGRIAPGGDIPVNASGGLMGTGHPVGATGVRMMLDAAKQVSGTAGDYQVPGARNVGLFNVGGSGTTNCAFVVGTD